MIDYTKQIKELNTYVLTKIAPSSIHGVGVFALRDIKKGQILYADMLTKIYTLPYQEFHRLIPEVGDMILERFPQVINGSKFLYPDTRIQAFMNHSSTPNYDAIKDTALVDIEQGEEITEDYRKIEGWEKIFHFLN